MARKSRQFGNFSVNMAEVSVPDHLEKRFDWEEGWVDVWVDSEDVWQVACEERLPNGHRLERNWNFPATERGWRRAMSTAWRLSIGEDIPPHEETEWI